MVNKNFFLIHLWILFQKRVVLVVVVFVAKLCLLQFFEGILFYTAATGPGGVEILVVIVLLRFLKNNNEIIMKFVMLLEWMTMRYGITGSVT